MKKMNFIKKENKKFALLSMLFLVLSCSNKTGNNSESTNSTTEQQKTVSPEEKCSANTRCLCRCA